MSVAIGSEYRTGEKAPVSGRYDFVRHISSATSCRPTPAERRIPLSKDETFPPCRSCKAGAVWRLVEKI
ncbi:MAG: YjzC family protein [Planctomycetes bacterium]|nr:YjzC family protein [Planctomycetota bacterium]